MTKFALYVPLEAKPGKEKGVARRSDGINRSSG